MNMLKRLTALLLCAALVLGLAACGTDGPSTETTAPPTEPPLDAPALYAAAADAVSSSEYVRMKAVITRSTAVGTDTYTKTSQQQFTWKNWGTDAMQAKITDDSTIGDIDSRTTEVYRDGAVYLTMEGGAYVSDMTAADFTDRWLSIVPLTAELYAEITAEENAGGVLISFGSPAAAEPWAASEEHQVLSASGTAQLDGDGAVTGWTYEVTYTQGGTEVTLSAEITMLPADALDLTLVYPEDDERYTLLDTPDIPLLLNDAWGYMAQFQSGTSTLTETFTSEALGATRTAATTLAAYGGAEDHMSSIAQVIATQIFYTNGELYDSYTYVQQETFRDGVYSVSADGGAAEENPEITGADMHNYCFNTLVSAYPYMGEITGASLTDFGGICLLELDCSTALAQGYSKTVCEYLTDDPDYLDSLSSAYKTNTMDYFWAINRDTGLPTACGITFSGTHTIEEVPYEISYQATQTFCMADPGAYQAITGEALPEETPAEAPTPVFYHVTGSEGQEMWLLGTIHVGDARTGALPQDIYDALDASGALAVEFDTDNFMELIAEDQELAERVLKSYYYLDGTTAADHLDPLVYASGMKLLKAAGSGYTQAALMKPYLWSQTIDNLYLQQGYNLVADKGVDNRLMAYAREKGITIKDVESGIAQIEMLAGFSDDLQELLLSQSIATTSREYIAEVQELYELWCAGDEAALIAYLQEDTADMTKQELALYEEYNKAVSTDRNADMLEVAKGYLESGEVIFYAVGLAHLLADDGLVNTLRDAGYTVELVSYGG